MCLERILNSGATRWYFVLAKPQDTQELAPMNPDSTLSDGGHRFQGKPFPVPAQAYRSRDSCRYRSCACGAHSRIMIA